MTMIFSVIILILSATVHEYMHGWMADREGDPTARLLGRLTFNPIKHLDLFGSVILPLTLVLLNTSFIFGWAKPVPYNPNNLRDKKWGDAKVAIAGPLGNLILAVVFSLVLRFISPSAISASLIAQVIIINLVLMIFNLVPIPPLDGSKILASFLPQRYKEKLLYMNQGLSMMLVMAFAFFGFSLLSPVIVWIFRLLTGFDI